MASETSITSGTVLLVKLLLEELAGGMYTDIYNYIVYSALIGYERPLGRPPPRPIGQLTTIRIHCWWYHY